MPGRHKGAAGGQAEKPLSRQHARLAGVTLKGLTQLWNASMGLPEPAVKAELIARVNATFVAAGLEPVYTDRKMSDAISNRMYSYRVKQRKADGSASATKPRRQAAQASLRQQPVEARQCAHRNVRVAETPPSRTGMDMECDLDMGTTVRPCGNDILSCRCDEPEPSTPTPAMHALPTWTTLPPRTASTSIAEAGGYFPARTASVTTNMASFSLSDKPEWLTQLELDEDIALPTPPSSPPGSPLADAMHKCWHDLPELSPAEDPLAAEAASRWSLQTASFGHFGNSSISNNNAGNCGGGGGGWPSSSALCGYYSATAAASSSSQGGADGSSFPLLDDLSACVIDGMDIDEMINSKEQHCFAPAA